LPPVEARYWPQALPKSSGLADKKFARQRAWAMNLSKTPSAKPGAGTSGKSAWRSACARTCAAARRRHARYLTPKKKWPRRRAERARIGVTRLSKPAPAR
jgi:hypothetical protein